MLEWKPRLVLALIAAVTLAQAYGGVLRGILPSLANHGW